MMNTSVKNPRHSKVPRMTISSIATTNDADRLVRIWLLSVKELHGKTHYRIAGRFTHDNQTWEVYRRYSEFLQLREKLIKYFSYADATCPGCLNYLHSIKQFEFPKKHLFVSKTQAVVNYRTKALRSFVNLLASWTFSSNPKCPTCGGFAFDVVRAFLVDGAEPIDGADMDSIRGTMIVTTFQHNQPERMSSTYVRTSERRPSWIPASGSTKLQEQQRASMPARPMDDPAFHDNAYETFNDYLPGAPKKQQLVGQLRPTANGSRESEANPADARRPGSLGGSFILYNDANSDTRSDVSFGSVSTDAYMKKGILKNKNEPINVRPLGDSFLSVATSNASFVDNQQPEYSSSYEYGRRSTPNYGSAHTPTNHPGRHSTPYETYQYNASQSIAQRPETSTTKTSVQQHGEVEHSNMLSSPNALPLESLNIRVRGTPKEGTSSQSSQLFDSFISDDLLSNSAEPILLPSDEEVKLMQEVDVDDDVYDDEIDVTGVALQVPSPPRRKSVSGEGLWQPWELARAG